MEENIFFKKGKHGKISLVLFVISISIVLVTMVSVIFPSLIVSTVHTDVDSINVFELGSLAISVIIINLIILFFGITYKVNLLPKIVYRGIDFILNFEVSRKVAFIAIAVLLGIYIGFSVNELEIDEAEEYVDFGRIKDQLENFPQVDNAYFYTRYVKNALLYTSIQIFDNIRIIPFIASVALILTTYFFTSEVSKKRFSGLIAMTIVLQSQTFLMFDSLATYDNFWVLFYVLSLYLIYKRWYLSPISFILSIFTKPLTLFYIPMTFFIIFNSKLSFNKKTYAILPYISLIAIFMILFFFDVFDLSGDYSGFEYQDFILGFSILSFQMRWDILIIPLLLPLTVGLYLKAKRGNKFADSVHVLIFWTLISGPIITGFTDFNIHPYRFVPLIIFVAIGIGTLFAAKTSKMLVWK